MDEIKQIKYLRISYWTGAIFDALVLIPMLSSTVGGAMLGITEFNPGPEYSYAMGIGASLMSGWVLLLLWANAKPMERKGVLLLTMFPVLFGLIASGIYAVNSNMVAMDKMIPIWIMQVLLVLLFGFSYLKARTASARGLNEPSNTVAGSTN